MRYPACAFIVAATVVLAPAVARADSLVFGALRPNSAALTATFFNPNCVPMPGVDCGGTFNTVSLLDAPGVTLDLSSNGAAGFQLPAGNVLLGTTYKGDVGASDTLRWTLTSADPVFGISCVSGVGGVGGIVQQASGVCDQALAVPSGFPAGTTFGAVIRVRFDPVRVTPGLNQLLHITLSADLLNHNPDFEPTFGAPLQEGVTTHFNVIAPTPEPASLLLLGSGLVGIYWQRQRRATRTPAA